MTRHVTCVVLALLTTALAAIAKDVKIGATSIDLTAPSGYCELRENNANEARVLKGLQDTTIRNQLLAAYADCQQLANYRPGKNPLLDDFAVYWTATSLMNVALPSDFVRQSCAELRAQGEQMLAVIAPDRISRIEEVLKGIKINEPRFLGVVAEDDLACYTAVLQKIKTDVGSEKTQVALGANMLARGKVITYNLYSRYVSGTTVATMLAKHKVNVEALVAANK